MLASALLRLLFKLLPERHHPIAWSMTMIACGVCLLSLSYSTLDFARRHQTPTDVPFALMVLLESLVAGLAVCALGFGLWLLQRTKKK
jgi:hypothetical protein